MQGMNGKKAGMLLVFMLFAGAFACLDQGYAAVVEQKEHYDKLPAFLETGVDPNLLLLIDNSASMYDMAYDEDGSANSCYDNGFDPTKSYAGYFDATPDTWYEYDLTTDERFESITTPGACTDTAAYAYGASDLCLILNSADEVTEIRATGRFWNWLTASKFDVEKEILTGGKYHNSRGELVLETRGCLEKRFIKEIPVTKQGDTNGYKATFAVRAADRDERVTDGVYYSSPATDPGFSTNNNTRIEIFKPTTTGFDMTACQAAIDLWEIYGGELLGDTDPGVDGSMGQLLNLTDNCLDAGSGSALNAENSAFNNILHFCYDYIADGSVANMNGAVTNMQTSCSKVWLGSGNFPQEPPSAYYEEHSPSSLGSSDICFGQFDLNRDHSSTSTDPWGDGYVGACVEPKASSFTTQFITCDPATYVRTPGDSRFCNNSTVSGFGDSNYVYFCDGSYNASRDTCSPASKWLKDTDLIPDEGGIISVDWTDDNGDAGDDCTEAAMKKFCRNMGEATVVDSTIDDPAGISWGVPSYLLDSAVESQMGEPLRVVKGRVYSDLNPDGSFVKPLGLVQEFKYNLRMGAMVFNKGAGTTTECYPEPRPPDNSSYRASLFDCLSAKGSAINATTIALDPSQSDGGRIISYIDDEDHGYNDYLVKQLNQIEATAWTPSAEAFFNAIGYFTQDNRVTADRPNGLRINGVDDFVWEHDMTLTTPVWTENTYYTAGAKVKFTHNWDTDGDGTADYTKTKLYFTRNGGTSTAGASGIDNDEGVDWTPYDPVQAGCQDNNILLISDGASTADINSYMTNLASASGDSSDTGTDGECLTTSGNHSQFGSTFLDDLTYYASQSSNTTLYPTGYQQVWGRDKQPIKTYVVSNGALDQSAATPPECSDQTLLTNAAENSGTTLFESNDPAQLKANLRTVFELIGGEVSSGSAASVISHSRSGDGAIYQAIFYPKQIDQYVNEVDWVGDVHALWLDEYGNMREDCGATDCTGGGDQILNPETDYIIKFYTNGDGSARASRFLDADGDYVETDIQLKDLNYLWSGAEWLAEASTDQRTYDSEQQARYIFTMLRDSTETPKMIPFTPAAVNTALTEKGKSYSAYFNAVDDTEANAIINYIRGDDQSYRSRRLDWDGDGVTETVKLGDIIHSTPTLVGSPAENYDVIYGDPTYRTFRKQYQNRRAVIYAGANDGGLHAFNGGYYDRHNKQFLPAPPASPALKNYDLGAELWMYVPKNVFPHLRWLTETDYGKAHNYYVDGKPYVFDAKIFTNDTIHPGGWGTVLVVGMRYGGGNIQVDSNGDGTVDETMSSAYIIMDITNPEYPPVVLAEFTHPGLGYTVGSPTAIPMLRCDKNTLDGLNTCNNNQWPMDWYLAFGSGPHSNLAPPAGPDAGMQGLSDQEAGLYILTLGGVGTTAALGNIGSGQTADGTDPTFLNQPELVGGQTLFPGFCSDPVFTNKTACEDHIDTWTPAHCSKEGYATEAACTDVPEVWTPGECSNIDYGTEASCTAAREIWTPDTCSNDDYSNQDDCVAAFEKWTWTAGTCSNDDYSNKTDCEAAFEKWTWTAGECSNDDYSNKTSCEAAFEKWIAAACSISEGGFTQSNCEAEPYLGIWTGDACSVSSWWFAEGYTIDDCKYLFSNTTWIDAACSNSFSPDQTSCEAAPATWHWTAGECSDLTSPGQTSCEAAPATWNWTAGECSDSVSSDPASCIAKNATWTPESCSNNSYDNQTECEDAPEVWTPGECSNDAYGNPTDCTAARETWIPDTCSDSRWSTQGQCTTPQETWTTINLGSSFYGDFIAVDYDLSFQVESLYFGSVYGANTSDHRLHKGALHRLVINDDPNPANWSLNTFYDVQSPVTAAPSVATDGSRAWLYFGTGRFFSAKEDKAILATTPPTQFLGLKENYDSHGEMDLYSPNSGTLVNVTDTVVMNDGLGRLDPTPLSDVTYFGELNLKMSELSGGLDLYNGWKIELDNGERVIGQPAILGDIVTFTSYIPSNDPCVPDGTSYLWAPYFRTGTAFYRSVIGTNVVTGGTEVLRKISLGAGLSTTPNIHTGAGDGSKAFVQSSTGAITSIEQTNPGVVKSGMRSWRELGSIGGSCN
ncbi:MAG: PilC/PilY family type IV pilus protein [Desulfurivibrionaceae bacterium]